jgi:hypothetical protein
LTRLLDPLALLACSTRLLDLLAPPTCSTRLLHPLQPAGLNLSKVVLYYFRSLNSVFEVRGIPSVIVVKAGTGEIISRDGRQEIMSQGSLAFTQWEESCIEIDTSMVSALADNPPQLLKDASEILLKLISNILRDPQSLKFRRIRLSNPKIEKMLLNANGAFEILFSMGFEEVFLKTICFVKLFKT